MNTRYIFMFTCLWILVIYSCSPVYEYSLYIHVHLSMNSSYYWVCVKIPCFSVSVYRGRPPSQANICPVCVSIMCCAMLETAGSMHRWTFNTSLLALTKRLRQFWWLVLLCSVLRPTTAQTFYAGSTACSFDWSVFICASSLTAVILSNSATAQQPRILLPSVLCGCY